MSIPEGLSLALSILAILVSAVTAVRQNAIQYRMANAPTIVDLFGQFRSPTVLDAYEFVVTELSSHDPKGGVSGLPKEARYRALNICNLLQQVGAMMILGLGDEAAFIALYGRRAIAAWDAIEPFARNERLLDKGLGGDFMGILETFAEKARQMPSDVPQRFLRKWLRRKPW